jgi:hypothetical protein
VKNWIVIWLALAASFAAGTGCTNVKPWQRGILAQPAMQADRDPLADAFQDHVYFSREAASGGRGIGGGGCGCN